MLLMTTVWSKLGWNGDR